MHLVTTEQMRRLEHATVEAGSTWAGLMEQAGWGVAQEALHHLATIQDQPVLVLVGPGNNGGDGLVVARHLHDAGARVTLYIWKRAADRPDANWKRCRERGLREVWADDDPTGAQLRELLAAAILVIDAMLGMGTTRPVEGALAQIVNTVNAQPRQAGPRPQVLAIDVPTGIHSDSGAVLGVALQADLTVATGLVKQGLAFAPGADYAGNISVVEIGMPPDQLETVMSETLSPTYARTLLPDRPAASHKGTFGKAMIVAGSLRYPGAAVLATTSAGRVGAGLVTLATARTILAAGGRAPEVTLLPLPEADWGTIGANAAAVLRKELASYTALLIGPGMGQEEATGTFLQRLLGIETPRNKGRVGFRVADAEPAPEADDEQHPAALPLMVLDADALNLLSKLENWADRLIPEHFILTPHPGEMRRLLGVEDLDDDRVQVATAAAAEWRQVVVLKGDTTVIAAPDGRSRVHTGGNPALATAGTGDVLAGAIVGLLAQGMPLFDAAALGVYLHSAAGELLRTDMGEMGTLASDLLPRLPLAIKELRHG
jgi:NAD(P)H-hydrate epimerase